MKLIVSLIRLVFLKVLSNLSAKGQGYHIQAALGQAFKRI
jgi:hypothetical protein